LEEVKRTKTTLRQFDFKNQSIQSITAKLVEVFRGELPQSVFCSKTYDLFKLYARGSYNETLSLDHTNAKSYDIKRCFTSILYDRKHAFGIFKPWDVPREYRGALIHGAKYVVVKPTLCLGEIKLGNGLYDSELVEKLLEEGFCPA